MKTWTTPNGEYNKLFEIMTNENHVLIAGAIGSGTAYLPEKSTKKI